MKLGIIGGSGLYNIEGIKIIDKISIETPCGSPSGKYVIGKIHDTDVVFLPRHGEGHTISPAEINHKANIFGMKKLGVTHIISISAVGSLKGELPPKDIVMIDQYIDRTKQPKNHTFFRDGIVAHIPFGDPICNNFKDFVFSIAKEVVNDHYKNADDPKPKIVNGGTYVNIEGPAFSTKAESKLFRSWGVDVVGMTSMTEAKLSREAEICYSTVAMVTDYDCWHPDHDNVNVEMVINTMKSNISVAKDIIIQTALNFHRLSNITCSCNSALENAIMTAPDKISEKLKSDLKPLIGKYLK